MEAPPGVRPAVLKVEKLDRADAVAGKREARKRAAGAVDYIYTITVASTK